MPVRYSMYDAGSATAVFPALVRLYAVVYAEPPYAEGPDQVAAFAAALPGEARRPGFTLVVADDVGELVGAAYGSTMAAGRWWTRADVEPPGDLRGVDKFAVMEWAVRLDRRREGIGAQLLRRLLDGRPEQWATLASNPAAPARAIYQRAGWQQVGGSAMPDGTPMHLLVLPLPATPVGAP
ncbi:GNAT family N-acetyltransferase [Micromonospora lupini]|uniref:GNAT family N-acetyltransferase n=1 Tax=Micromonospora lupini TaxID=285679 RepID=UPI0022518687|nr:GNAT family N-acetyltransferase [Micromonospora lupini]MCX5066341.1 GNAT family N-acetyltransferase [Micromonospora lupini]